jgi:hypothetical protein
MIQPEGTIAVVEESIALNQIPAAARKALQIQAGSGKIISVESLTEGSTVN